jgi:transposase
MEYSIGVDISDKTYTCSCVDQQFNTIWYGKTFPQDDAGWQRIPELITQHKIARDKLRGIVLENTGCYSEAFCHWFFHNGFSLYVEPPKQVKKALCEEKTDEIDSEGIAQYMFRYWDKLHPWQPPDEIIEQIRILLKTYEDMSRIESKSHNKLKSYQKKHHCYPGINQIYKDLKKQMGRQMRQVEKNLKTTIATHPHLKQKTQDVMALKYTGIIMTSHLLVATNGYKDIHYPSLARYIGVYPLKFLSGTSVNHVAQSRGSGPKIIRKNLYATAMRLIGHNDDFKKYYKRKLAEGVKGKIVLNDVINRFLRIVCGVLHSGIPYTQGYRSVKPE